jgi:hypothetical protein
MLRDDLSDARRSLALARRADGHLLALVAKLWAESTSGLAPPQSRGRGRGHSRKRKEPADAPDYLPSAGDVDAWYFENDYS